MPKEYTACVASEMKRGKAHKTAQRMCAIAYYKRTGMTVAEGAKKEGEKMASDIPNEPEMFKMFVPFAKVHGENDDCIVEGYATTESLDSQGEEVDLQASFDAADEWIKYGNIREMHQPSAAGVAITMEKHAGKGVFISSKIIDPTAKAKVREGVYKGYSIGGRVILKEGRRIKKYRMLEVSLVDRPANPDCLFSVAKMADEVSDLDASVEADRGETMTEEVNKASTPGQQATPPETNANTQPEQVSISKAEFEEMKKSLSRLDELEKAAQKEADVKAELLKAVDGLKAEIKKKQSDPAENEKTADQAAKEQLSKMDMGSLTAMMLKGAKKE